jgi:hypothetical protein
VVRDIVKAYYDKKSGKVNQEYTTKEWRPGKTVSAAVNTPSLAQARSER